MTVIPTPAELRAMRATLKLTSSEMEEEIGFVPEGGRHIRALETGARHGKSHKLSGPAAKSLERLMLLRKLWLYLHAPSPATLHEALRLLEEALPDKLKRPIA